MNAETPRATQPLDKRTLSLADNVQDRIARGEDLNGEDQVFVNKLLRRLHNGGVKLSHIIGEQPTIAALTNQILALKKPQGKALPDPSQQARNRALSEENAALKRKLAAANAEKQEISEALEAAKENSGVAQLRDTFEKVSAALAEKTSENQDLRVRFEALTRNFSALETEANALANGDQLQENIELYTSLIAPLVPKFLEIANKIDDSELQQRIVNFAEELNKSLFQIYLGASVRDYAKGLKDARKLINTRFTDGQDKVFPIRARNRLNAFGFTIEDQMQTSLDEVDDPDAKSVDFGCINVHRRLDSFDKDNLRYYEIIECTFELKDEDRETSFRFPFYMIYAPNHFPKTPCVVIPPKDLEGENSEGKKADLVLGQHNPWFDFDDGKPIKDADHGCEPHCNLQELPINRLLMTLDEAISVLQEDVIELLAEGGFLDVKLTREVQDILNLDFVS